uniref:Uncharacterized protein n=1 Tax=Nelumbo nucifera TaxID=4432 RepID=A0A822Z3U4_NELNU|nr:TPA_asm: hypothetical protein HUJ06_008750 [Nelumbo nucifera]
MDHVLLFHFVKHHILMDALVSGTVVYPCVIHPFQHPHHHYVQFLDVLISYCAASRKPKIKIFQSL